MWATMLPGGTVCTLTTCYFSGGSIFQESRAEKITNNDEKGWYGKNVPLHTIIYSTVSTTQ